MSSEPAEAAPSLATTEAVLVSSADRQRQRAKLSYDTVKRRTKNLTDFFDEIIEDHVGFQSEHNQICDTLKAAKVQLVDTAKKLDCLITAKGLNLLSEKDAINALALLAVEAGSWTEKLRINGLQQADLVEKLLVDGVQQADVMEELRINGVRQADLTEKLRLNGVQQMKLLHEQFQRREEMKREVDHLRDIHTGNQASNNQMSSALAGLRSIRPLRLGAVAIYDTMNFIKTNVRDVFDLSGIGGRLYLKKLREGCEALNQEIESSVQAPQGEHADAPIPQVDEYALMTNIMNGIDGTVES